MTGRVETETKYLKNGLHKVLEARTTFFNTPPTFITCKFYSVELQPNFSHSKVVLKIKNTYNKCVIHFFTNDTLFYGRYTASSAPRLFRNIFFVKTSSFLSTKAKICAGQGQLTPQVKFRHVGTVLEYMYFLHLKYLFKQKKVGLP